MKAIYILKHKFIHAFLLVVTVIVPQSILAKTATEIFDARSPIIVMVAAFDQADKVSAAGTGVILWDGVVVTNCHVIKGADHFKVVHQRKSIQPQFDTAIGIAMSAPSP